MRDLTGRPDGIRESLRILRRHRDTDRGDAHRRAVCGPCPAHAQRVLARAHALEGRLRGGAQQVERPALDHRILPGQQCVGELARVQRHATRGGTPASYQEGSNQQRLLRVICDRPGRHPRRVGLRGVPIHEAGNAPVHRADLRRRHRLRRHAQRVSESQASQGAIRARKTRIHDAPPKAGARPQIARTPRKIPRRPVGPGGLEPPTYGLKVRCSTIEL